MPPSVSDNTAPGSNAPSPATVYVVDDDASYLPALERLLRASGYEVKSFPSAQAFLAEFTGTTPGCILADLHMPDMDGLELQAALARIGHPMPVVFLTARGDIRSSVRAMRDGAEDFLPKLAPKEELLAAVQRAVTRDMQERAGRDHHARLRARFDALTDREREVLGHVVQGKLNKQIAAELELNERTVKLHRTAITTKLGVPSVAELTKLWVAAGFDTH